MHVSLNEQNEVVLDAVIRGDTVSEVLHYVQFNSKYLLEQFRKDVEVALREGRVGYEEVGPAAALLRRRHAGLHVSRGCPQLLLSRVAGPLVEWGLRGQGGMGVPRRRRARKRIDSHARRLWRELEFLVMLPVPLVGADLLKSRDACIP